MRWRTAGDILDAVYIPGANSSIVEDKKPRVLLLTLRVTTTVIDMKQAFDAINHFGDELEASELFCRFLTN